jgi:hypothetical protein
MFRSSFIVFSAPQYGHAIYIRTDIRRPDR